MPKPYIIRALENRQIRDGACAVQRKLHVTNALVQRLSLETELEGHTGCVNCLQWNDKGDLLASGSDDLNINLWAPFDKKLLHSVQSGHHGNIFSVRFVPGTSDNCVVSGAADFKIRVNNFISEEATFSCSCHGGRVKRIATAPNVPNMFWSAAEDGMVLQFDLRSPHQCSNICKNVLVNLANHLGRNAEAKCLAINPVNPYLVAVGANDPYVRIYDRRMIKTITARFPREHPSSPWDFTGNTAESGEDNLSHSCVSYFVAGHLPSKYDEFKRRHRSLTSTYVTFSPDGTELLANLGGEQIYLFNVTSKRKQLVFDLNDRVLDRYFDQNNDSDDDDFKACCDVYQASKASGTNGLTKDVEQHSANCFHRKVKEPKHDASTRGYDYTLPKKVNEIKMAANQAFQQQKYNIAITLYSSAIVMYPNAPCLYANRAAAFMKRRWDGDNYAAVRDCMAALDLDYYYLKAHYRLTQCLNKLDWDNEAWDSLQAFKLKFPHFERSKSFLKFEAEIKRYKFTQSCKEYGEVKEIKQIFSDEGSSSSSASGSSYSSLGLGINRRNSDISDNEKAWRNSAYDYEYRYCGHCNTTTDIKEANFFGSYGEFIVAGSDDGSIFIWDRVTANIVRVLRGDDSIVNCLQPHPEICMLATSGIDPVVRLWSPRAEDGSKDDREIEDKDDVAIANQRRMNADPLEVMLLNMGYRLPGVLDRVAEELNNSNRGSYHCTTS